MRGDSEKIDQALAKLGDVVAGRLSGKGWNRRLLDDGRTSVTLTRSAPNGVMTVLRIDRRGFRWPDGWPVEVEATLGVGYEPALNLMPLLTLDCRALLVDDPEHGRGNSFVIVLDGLDGVVSIAEQIVRHVDDHASGTVHNFPDAAAIEEQLQREIEAMRSWAEQEVEAEDRDPGASDFDTQLRLVVLAAMGRHDEARALLATYPAEQSDAAIDRDDRRFIRQLGRWLDAGGPAAPPVEETLAQLPRRARRSRPSLSNVWADARAESKAKKEALDAVRAQSKGKSVDQLRESIRAEYGARGIEIAPSVVDFNAKMLQTEQQPFGRARNALNAIRMLKAGGADAIRLIKQISDQDPAWLQPPARAAYPMIADRSRYTPIELDDTAHDWLERVYAEAPRRTGGRVLIDVWLSREEHADLIRAHIGKQHVGTVRPVDSEKFKYVLQAADLFDEDPFVRGRLAIADPADAAVLEIPLPEQPDRPATAI